jgi:hypothetical protein
VSEEADGFRTELKWWGVGEKGEMAKIYGV